MPVGGVEYYPIPAPSRLARTRGALLSHHFWLSALIICVRYVRCLTLVHLTHASNARKRIVRAQSVHNNACRFARVMCAY